MPFFHPLRWTRRIVTFVVLAAVIYLIVSGVQVLLAATSSTSSIGPIAPARVIVVLPGGLVHGRPTPALTDELEQALSLFVAHRAKLVAVAEGVAPLGRSASPGAAAMHFLEHSGLPPADATLLATSNDEATLAAVATRYGDHGLDQVIIVTDPLHVLLVQETAAALSLRAEISAAVPPKQGFVTELDRVWLQASGIAVGRIIGFSRVGWGSG